MPGNSPCFSGFGAQPWRPNARYPPYRAIPFRDSIAEGVSHPFCLVFMRDRGDTPFVGGDIAPPLHMLSKGERGSGSGGGGVSGHVETPTTPIARNRGGIAEIVSQYRAIPGH